MSPTEERPRESREPDETGVPSGLEAATVVEGAPSQPPERAEPDQSEEFDTSIPGRGYQTTPMVGLGGSAGGIGALTEFFKAMPPDSGMVFVVVLHLSPAHQSTLAELLGRTTAMSVVQAEDSQKVETNTVYVIPPAKYLAVVDGHLKLTELNDARGKRVAVDLFFRSLADAHGPRATAVVLSGADGDGALGIKRVKEHGGLTIAQDPNEAEHAAMPRAAIDTGMVDWVLEVSEMPRRLLEYHRQEQRLKLPPEEGPSPRIGQPPGPHDTEAALRDVLRFLRARTGRDFSYYKRATILRRIGRRMQVNSVEDLHSYLGLLRTQPGETGALLQDLLISVTNFFRDREAFDALERRIPDLFRNKSPSDSVRVWVPACATGEEAYSIAILLLEHARRADAPPVLQVFACDLDDEAIRKARAGHYPDAIAADVNEERLARYFVKEHHGYSVRRELREMVLFASHDLLKDPPFSRMDLISCRNLLIYLNRDAQKRAFETFHFALKPDGLLFLGSSEAVDDASRLFRVLDKAHRLYIREPATRVGLPLPAAPSSLLRIVEARQHERPGSPAVHGKGFLKDAGAASVFSNNFGLGLDRAALAELHLRLLELFGPPSIIVNADHEVVHLSEHAGQFLRLEGGEPTLNLPRAVHPALRADLRATLLRAAELNVTVEAFDLRAEIEGRPCTIDLRVSPAHEIAPGYWLVSFNKRDDHSGPGLADAGAAGALAAPKATPGEKAEPIVRHLERELEQIKSRLRTTVEQYEASTEELKASNEELQAMNEELRSATEELETSREELQSINEELTTVNLEMKGKVEEVALANSDLQNLMAATAIATIFLDRGLAIKRYTSEATAIFHLIPGDIGRPLAHLKHQLEYSALIDDVADVLRTLVPLEREVSDGKRWFLARIQPYRTLEDHIAGAVLTFVDISERKLAAEALRVSEERMRILIESAHDYAIFTVDPERRIESWSKGAEMMFGHSEQEAVGQLGDVLFTSEDRDRGDPEREVRTAREEGRAANERWHARKDGSMFYGSGIVAPLRDKSGPIRGYVKIMRDLTLAKKVEEELHARMDELTRFNAAAVAREGRMIELKQEVNALRVRLDEPERYPLDFARNDPNQETAP